jgi:hypothetical protein
MPTWHVLMTFQVPRGAEVTGAVVEQLKAALPEATEVDAITEGRLQFMLRAEGHFCIALFAAAHQRLSDACTDVLGLPVELLHAELDEFDHWLDEIQANEEFRRWVKEGPALT